MSVFYHIFGKFSVIFWNKIKKLKTDKHQSWTQLIEGCTYIKNGQGEPRPNAIAFANVVMRETNLSPEEIIDLVVLKSKVKDYYSK